MLKPSRSQVRSILGSLAIVLLLVGFLVGDYFLHGDEAKLRHEQVVGEFNAIRPLPNAALKSTRDTYRPPWSRNNRGTVAASYRTHDKEFSIRQHYERELISHGWQFVLDQPYKSWGENSGEHAVFYCKQSLYAGLEFRGPEFERQAPEGGGYEFYVAWGIRPAELRGKCD
jgi:hypothetical protein